MTLVILRVPREGDGRKEPGVLLVLFLLKRDGIHFLKGTSGVIEGA